MRICLRSAGVCLSAGSTWQAFLCPVVRCVLEDVAPQTCGLPFLRRRRHPLRPEAGHDEQPARRSPVQPPIAPGFSAVALGRLEYRKGDYNAAEKTLEDAISRNAGPEGLKARAKAYRILADVCRAKGEALKAKGYETVLKELFNDE